MRDDDYWWDRREACLQYIHARLVHHQENLRLWQNGYLIPTAEDAQEVEVVIAGLKAAIAELHGLLQQDLLSDTVSCP